MVKKSSVWLVVLVAVVAIAFIATGCAKKQVVKEEAAPKPVVEVKKEEPPAPAPAPAPAPPPPKEEAKVEAPAPAPAPPPPKVEAAPVAEKAAPPDLRGLRIQFAFDDYNLSNKSKENLEKIASWMSKDSAAKVQIEGHTCDIGTAEYNLALGERRANSAKKYLEGLGVNAARISTISYGEERPMVPNSDEGNRSKNRRDEFLQSK
jgi:peptidoglycan-associated lipoprotein